MYTMKITSLNETNLEFYAMTHYDNPSCTDVTEFHEDMARFKYLKRLFRKYKTGREVRPRLVFNHLIVLYNVFGIDAATNLLFYRIDADLHSVLKTYLVFLNYFPTSDAYISLCDSTDIDDVRLDPVLLHDLNNQYGNEVK
jgi:hypothetical protein